MSEAAVGPRPWPASTGSGFSPAIRTACRRRATSLAERPVEQPGPGQLLVRAHYPSVDPDMRGPISQRRNYAAGVQIGQVMTGGGMGEAVASRHPDFAPGDIVESFTFGWRDYAVLGPAGTRRIDPGLGPIHSAPASSARRGSRPISRS